MEFARFRLPCQAPIAPVLRAIALLALLTGCGTTNLLVQGRPARQGDRVILPTTGTGGPFLVRATVNNAGPYLFVLDTGSTRTVVSDRLVAELALTTTPTQAVVLDAEAQKVAPAGETSLDRLALGPFETHAVHALVMDLSRFERALGERIDGIAPATLFEELTLVIDYSTATVWCTPDRLHAGLPIRHDRLPVVRADVAGQPIDVLIDSASGGAWMLPIARLPVAQVGYQARRVEQADRTTRRSRAELQGTIRLADQVFDRPIVEDTSGIARVGFHALRGCRVSIDRRSRRLTIERIAPVANEPVWGIGARLERVADLWEVRGIEPGLPADTAGLTDGERILAIDGKRADQLDAAALAALIASADRVRLDVLRAGGVEQVWVPITYIQP